MFRSVELELVTSVRQICFMSCRAKRAKEALRLCTDVLVAREEFAAEKYALLHKLASHSESSVRLKKFCTREFEYQKFSKDKWLPKSNCNTRQWKPLPWVDFHRKFGIVKDVIENPAKYIDPLLHACSMTPESWMGVAATAITASERFVDRF